MVASTAPTRQESAFPVEWTSVAVPGTLTRDEMHFPHPLSPMTASLNSTAFVYGHRKASREYHLGIRFQVVMINHYRYDGVLPPDPINEVEAGEQGRLAEEAVGQVMGRQLDRWNEEHFPALEEMLNRLRDLDPRGLPADRQIAMLDDILRIQSDLWTIHFRITSPMMISMQVFGEFYSESIGGTAQDAQALLVGTNSRSVAAGIALGDLANSARTLGLESLFREAVGEELMAALREIEPGRAFLEQLDQYLEIFGLRSDLFYLEDPLWQEDPSVVLATIASYLQSGYDARAAQMEAAGQADAAVDRAREFLAVYPEAMRETFESLLTSARHGAFLQEEHNFYIDQQGTALTRLVLLRFGEDFVARGILAHGTDIFMLTFDEVREIVGSGNTPELQHRIRNLVERRRRELEIARSLDPPPFVGTPPETSPNQSTPAARALLSFFGGPPKESEDPSEILGNPGSQGSVTGVARVARSLVDAKELRPGEILVATTTMPAWTPLFGIAAAVVTETGGSLSHCAIVAREYGIPAVVGASRATRRVTTGQRITVDGTRGVVTLH